MRRERMALAVIGVILLASIGVNVYQYGLTNRLNPQTDSKWSEVRLGYVVINGTAFNEANSNITYDAGYVGHTTFHFFNVTFVLSNGCPNCNGSQSFVFKVAYHGTGSQGSWNATLTIVIFADGLQNLSRAAFTSGTSPSVGIIWGRDGYFHFLVSV
ncbi:MAG TPA: hypothetical protein VK126_02305 [Nitrososphaerales archaeon]|nr:hypothetical protein [Nitrososphaerales archaeon]